MKKTYIIFVICFFAVYQMQAQVKIRQSFQSAETKAKPATLSYTNPKEGDESYLIDFALGVNLLTNTPSQSLYLFGEYHRNTLIDQEQNNIQGGISYEIYTNRLFGVPDPVSDVVTVNSTSVINATAKYNYNEMDTLHSTQVLIDFTRLYNQNTALGRFIPHNYIRLGTEFRFIYSPSIGIENELVLNAPDQANEGYILRGVGKLYLGIKPFTTLLDSRLELYFDINQRYDIINTISLEQRSNELIDTGINWTLLESSGKYLKLAASFNKGSNPIEGLKEQEYILVALKLKI